MQQLDKNMKAAKSDTERVHILGDAVWDIHIKNPVLADSIAMLEIKYGKQSADARYEADAYNDAGVVKYRLGDYATCEEYYLHSMDLRKKDKNEKGVAACLGKLGALYQKKGNLDKALECQLECLKIQEKYNNKGNIALTYNNIAVIHSNQRNFRKAIDYSRKAMEINLSLPNKTGLMGNYNTLSSAYAGLKRYDSALLLLDSVVSLADILEDKYSKAIAYCNIGNTYEHLKDSAHALDYFIKALDLAKENKSKAAIGMYSQNIGDLYRANAQYDKAEPYLLSSYQIAKELNQKPVLYLNSLSLYYLYKQRGDLTKAAAYVEESIAVKDSVFNEESSRQIAEMQTKYETEKKEQQLQIQHLQINRRNIILIVLCLVFALSVLIGWLSYNRYKLRQKALMDSEMLRQQELRAKAILDAEEQERQRIGQDLHDGVGQILSAAKLNLSALQSTLAIPEQGNKDKMQNALDLLDESVKEVRSISHSMMPNMLIKSGLASAVRDFVNKMTGDKLKIDLDIVGTNKRLDSTIEAVLFRIFQEIVNNIIRHSGANQVTIQLLQHDQEIVLMVEDNGKGFDVGKTLQNENGIGLKNITSRVDYLHGTIHFDSVPGRGTTVIVEIPIRYETDHS
jgi:signal transduction histidine kinase